jgi:hypothetical protein
LNICTYLSSFLFKDKSVEAEDLPSMETLEISKNKNVKSTPSGFDDQDEEDIPDMADYEEPDNLIETDAVSFIFCIVPNWCFSIYTLPLMP